MVWSQLISVVGRRCNPAIFLWQHKFSRCISQSTVSNAKVCVIGSGPAGFYTAQHVLKHNKYAQVDIFEKLPVPFGLVRYGVAPDHPEVKNATSSFEEIARDDRCRFFGNVNVGQDIKASELRNIYDAVVFAYGADDDKRLHIPGEDANGVLAARSFVGWYNGLPAHSELSPNLNCDTAVIIGQGNVALDVARILLAPTKLLQHTDICSHSLDVLQSSKIKHVFIVGRRGPLEVAFTIKELREMIRLPDTRPIFHPDDFVHVRPQVKDIPRQRRRLIELMCKTALDENSPEEEKRRDDANKEWELKFLYSPVEILTDQANNVKAIKLQKNQLVKNENGSVSPVATDEYEIIQCGMVLRSIGYKSIRVEEGIPFDIRLGIIPNINGRVVDSPSSKDFIKGLYCSGWVKHGPVGVIVTTMNESFATAQNIVEDLKDGDIVDPSKQDIEVTELLKDRGIQFVTFEDYEKIDMEEIFRGKHDEKPREKITSSQEMLDIAFKTE